MSSGPILVWGLLAPNDSRDFRRSIGLRQYWERKAFTSPQRCFGACSGARGEWAWEPGEAPPPPTSLHPPSLAAHHRRGPQRPCGCCARRTAGYKLHWSSCTWVSSHQRVKGTQAFQKSEPKVQQGQVNKPTKQTEDQ